MFEEPRAAEPMYLTWKLRVLLRKRKMSLPNFSRNRDGLSMIARKFGNLFAKMLKEQPKPEVGFKDRYAAVKTALATQKSAAT